MAAKDSPEVELFKKKSAIISAQIVEVKGLKEAIAYALDLCEKKDFCEVILSGCGEKLSEDGAAHCEKASAKMIAAPGLDAKDFAQLEKDGKAKGFTVIREGMRDYLSGIDVGFVTADMGIAETGSCVIASENEDLRISTMVCEINVIALPKSKIVNSLYDAEEFLNKVMADGTMYTSFISGPSRTADIERVLTLGVHGPLELHVALMEG
ncbi:lactate utilization protein [Desulfovibrio sp. OttesenSCG-928-G15]|nr:lactate utilization protein [Desulfovibrio sp. OttesenSCG-928-G15]